MVSDRLAQSERPCEACCRDLSRIRWRPRLGIETRSGSGAFLLRASRGYERLRVKNDPTETCIRQGEERGVDAVIAQGLEAGGHRGMFLTTEPASQLGTLALVPQVVDAVKIPVIAAGGGGLPPSRFTRAAQGSALPPFREIAGRPKTQSRRPTGQT